MSPSKGWPCCPLLSYVASVNLSLGSNTLIRASESFRQSVGGNRSGIIGGWEMPSLKVSDLRY